jgi:glutamine cyclotransferase
MTPISPTTRRKGRAGRHAILAFAAGAVVVAASVVLLVFRPDVPSPSAASPSAGAAAPGPAPARYAFTVVNEFPHDPEAFTQGLIYRDGYLFESTGLNGRSSLRKVRIDTGEVVRRIDVDARHFAEGLVDWNSRLIQLTWQSNVGFVYALDTFALQQTFSYSGEGWGLTRDDNRLIMSDGSAILRFMNPETLDETGRLAVTERGLPVSNLNELEMVRGEILANIWQTDEVVVIAPDTGHVTARIDFAGLRTRLDPKRPIDVFNGLAWDDAGGRLFVTGKLWPRLFEVRIDRP